MIVPQSPYDIVITENGRIIELEKDAEMDVVEPKKNLSHCKKRDKHVSFDTEAYMALVTIVMNTLQKKKKDVGTLKLTMYE
eukprot:CAMPEP_0194210664 /NCGR_PEP_ID=MMETSP0156-20130528/8913_1 /TAXON_ID=33649 /ORGANISM="Thalassionema nitzschioides, Strain L26-B" /LENGTH=80 /DNA_ID=CAMNT_0038938035 /DNA_START=53 /DNA_END=296 /DNA_ORIENTATION=-